ncbi:hypothetical protein ACOMHN_058969 [Nucella lapillus]
MSVCVCVCVHSGQRKSGAVPASAGIDDQLKEKVSQYSTNAALREKVHKIISHGMEVPTVSPIWVTSSCLSGSITSAVGWAVNNIQFENEIMSYIPVVPACPDHRPLRSQESPGLSCRAGLVRCDSLQRLRFQAKS